MSTSLTTRYTLEGGRFYLAEALFDQHRFQIRCPNCEGTPGEPGFIKDQGGKGSPDGRARRQWACQRSNSKKTALLKRCGRVTCTEYIDLARQQLAPTQFQTVLAAVCQTVDSTKPEHLALQGYQDYLLTHKRKAEEDLPHSIQPPHHRPILQPAIVKPQTGQEDVIGSMRKTMYLLEYMMGFEAEWARQYENLQATVGDWHRQHELLSIFLEASSPVPATQPSSTPTCPTPGLGEGRQWGSDMTIPCSEEDEESVIDTQDQRASQTSRVAETEGSLRVLSSSQLTAGTQPEILPQMIVPVAQAVVDNMRPEKLLQEGAKSLTLPQRAQELVELFHQAAREPRDTRVKRGNIREMARKEGVMGHFQSLLIQQTLRHSQPVIASAMRVTTANSFRKAATPMLPSAKKPKSIPELQCSEQR